MGDPEQLSAYILIQGPGHDGTRLALREGITSFGRLPSNDVILLGDLVSRHHSRITFFEGKATLQDLGSHNGSWVNGERVTTRVLKAGDIVRVGNFRLTFHDGQLGDGRGHDDAANAAATQEETRSRPDATGPTRRPLPSPDLRAPMVLPGLDEEPSELPDFSRGEAPSGSVLIQEIERVRAGGAQQDERSRALMLLYRATEALAKGVNLKSYLQELLTLILEQIKADYAVFFRSTEAGEPEMLAARDRKGPRTDPCGVLGVVRWVVQKNFAVTTDDATTDFRFQGDPSLRGSIEATHPLVCVPVASRKAVLGAIYISRAASAFTEAEVDALSAIAHLSVVGVERAEIREQAMEEGLTREMLSRFHTPDVVQRILESTRPGEPPRPFLDGKAATVMFCDIQGFTALTERLPVEELSELLNTYLEQMSDITLAHRGTIDRFHGASVMSIFGAPFSYGNDAGRAVAAALEMRDAFDALVRSRPNVGPRRLRVGLNTGWVLAGTVGFGRRLEYTAIGETVSAAARLESSAAPGAILIGEATFPLISELFDVRKLGLQQLHGRLEPMQVYEVLGRRRNVSRAR